MIQEITTPTIQVGRMPTRQRVLVLSANNSGTAEMAEAWLRKLGAELFDVNSASLVGPGKIHDLASRVMSACGLSVSEPRPADNRWLIGKQWDLVIALRDRSEAGPCAICVLVGSCIHWDCPDPALVGTTEDARLRAFERTCAELLTRVRLLVAAQAKAEARSNTGLSGRRKRNVRAVA